MAKVNLQELLNGNEPVFVLNRTGRMRDGKSSTFILTVKDAHGDATAVPIPATKWPIDISAMVPRKALQESKDLFRACRPGGPLEVIPPDKARTMLQDPMAQRSIDAALARLERSDNPRPKFTMEVQKGDQHSRRTERATPQIPDQEVTAMAPKLVVAKTDVAPRIKQLCASAQNHPETVDDTLAMLAGIPDDELSSEELGYCLRECREFPKITKWVKAELARRNTEDTEVDDDDDEPVEDPDEPETPAVAPRRRRHRR